MKTTEKDKEIAELKAEIIKLKTQIAQLKASNEHFLELLRIAQHRRFSSSRERSVVPEQLGLFNEAESIADEEISEQQVEEEVVIRTRKKAAGKRKEFYENLKTEQVVHELPEEERICPDCGGPLHACGHEVLRREVEVIPAQVRAIEHVQTVYACRGCERNADTQALVKAAVPAPVIRGSGIASPSLLAYILCNKYSLALPLRRQEQELHRQGVHISRQTMANWIIFAANRWLKPMYGLLHTDFLKNDANHADETTVQVILEDGRSASQKSYAWMYCTGKDAAHQVVLFEYKPTREGKNPLEFLVGYKGFLHVDAYAGYRRLEEQGVTLVGCWSHVRRKFDEALKALRKGERNASDANTGLDFCNKLFALERKFDELRLSGEERRDQRNLESKPISEAFFLWAEELLPKTRPKSKLNQAVSYALNQRSRLMNYLLDGRLELSNNRAERAIRPFAIGRKNWLFSYCALGAEASAIAYSIIETAQANGLVPYLYLAFLFQRLPNISPEQFHECLPWNPVVQEMCKIPTIE